MSDTTPVETGNDAPKNEGNDQGTPPVQVTAQDTAVEELRKQLQQQEMRANQLANQLKAKDEAEAAAKAKELEEQNQYKELFEQEKAKREAIEAEREASERQAAVEKAKSSLLSEYSDEVKALADEVGLDLSSDDETAVAAYKEKLDKIQSRVTKTETVTGNNQRTVVTKQSELSQEELRANLSDPKKFDEMMQARFPGVAQMRKQ